MNTGTPGNPVYAPDNLPGMARAWVKFAYNATLGTVVVLAPYNVASVTRVSTGIYLVAFVRPFAHDFCTQVTAARSAGDASLSACIDSGDPGRNDRKQFSFHNTTGFVDPAEVNAVFFGQQ